MAKKTVKKSRTPKREFNKGKYKSKAGPGAGIAAGNIILLAIFVVLAYLIVVGPFQRGLFFSEELLPVHILSFSLLILWCASKLLRGEGALLKAPLDYCVFALVVFYFFSFFVAVNKSAALGEFLKVANYLVIYLLVFDLCRSDPFAFLIRKNRKEAGKAIIMSGESGSKHGEPGPDKGSSTGLGLGPGLLIILHILLVAGTAVALGGLGTAAGTWDIHGAYVGGRIHTSLQYPNTAAAYLTAAYFIALGLSSRVGKWYLRPVYLVPAIVIFITFIFTYSRGAWLLIPFLAVLFVLVIGRGNRLRAAIYLALSGVVALLLMVRIDNALRGDEPALVWKYLLISVFLIIFGGILTELFLFSSRKVKAAVAGIAAVFVLLAGLQVVLPALGRPLYLERKPGEKPASQYLEQRVGGILPGEKYLLSLEVDAVQEPAGGEGNEEAEYAWRLLVLAYDLEDKRTTLLDHREGPTRGWEKRQFELQLGENTERMEVRLYNHFPGTAVSARNVFLLDSGGERPLNFTLHRILPDRVYKRIFSIGVGESSVEGRLTFYRDALKIIGDYPLLGAGGGAWKSLYLGYQEKPYFTTEVHNHFLQVWIEAGTPGFLAFAGIWVFFIWAFLRGFFGSKTTPEKRERWASVFVPAVALGAHSAIDFNLSLGAVSVFLFALLGAGRSLDEDEGYFSFIAPGWRKNVGFSLPGWSTCAAGILAGVFLMIISISLWNGHRLGVEAENKVQENRMQEAVELFEKAISADPYQPSNYANLGRIYEHLSTFEENRDAAPRLVEMALGLTRKAYELEPFNAGYNLDYGAMLLRHGYLDEGLHHIERLVELHPRQPDSFAQVARAKLAAAEHYLHAGDEGEADEQLREVLLLEEKMVQMQDSAEKIYFYLGEAAFLLGDYDRSREYFTGMGEKDENYNKSLVYLAVIYERCGKEDKAGELKEMFAENSELHELYRQLLAVQE
ncbi:MAG TPA: hypothetical protein GX004_04770 [Firmicutes bacterium]|nr:hypothetical protein [Bacillota bacterium]